MPDSRLIIEAYNMGYDDGLKAARATRRESRRTRPLLSDLPYPLGPHGNVGGTAGSFTKAPKPKRKLSAWQKFVKAQSKRPKYKKMNNTRRLKAIGVAWRKTPAGKKKRR